MRQGKRMSRNVLAARGVCLVAALGAPAVGQAAVERAADYVIHVSVDGLRPDAIAGQTAAQLPNFYRLREEGAFTDNARTDVDRTTTLPNHTSMLTGRRVDGAAGHAWTGNNTVPADQTLHSNKGSYVASAFDVAHAHGMRTGLYASKSKFSLFPNTYDADTAAGQGGAPDTTGGDDGRDKIDTYVHDGDTESLVNGWATAMKDSPFRYSFLHFADPDVAGHDDGWDVTEPPDNSYMDAVRAVDRRLGTILSTIADTPALAGRTTVILSADHGGDSGGHGDEDEPDNYTIPFYVWGAGVTAGDLYALNAATRLDPGTEQPTYAVAVQPIRNGDGGNLALDMLGLTAIPGSTINADQSLGVVPEPTTGAVMAALAAGMLLRRGRRGARG